MDPQLLMALLGPEGMMAMQQPPVAVPPPMMPTGLPSPAPVPPPMPQLMAPGPVRPPEPYMSQPMPAPIAQPASLGAALEPMVPMPQPRPAEAPQAAAAAPGGSKILDSLKGVKAPDAPTPQKVSTPNAPQIRPIQGGGLFDLLASLGIGPQQAMQGMKLPSTLGQALEPGRR